LVANTDRAVLLIVVATLLGSCASVERQADDLFAAGDFDQAAQAYEAYLEADPEVSPAVSRALYRLAVTYGSSNSSLYNPERSLTLLEQLLSVDPHGEYSLAARVMLHQQKEIVSLRAVVTSRRDLIQALIADLSKLQDHLSRTQLEVGEKDETVQALSVRIEHLRSEIFRLTRQLSDREAELERLKEIDLEVPPL
jgi:tetratricopeptide (TPR) repeat protein